jgi:hypothetical protein
MPTLSNNAVLPTTYKLEVKSVAPIPILDVIIFPVIFKVEVEELYERLL